MTRLFNDPADFASELTEGFIAAHGAYVFGVEGGVVRAAASEPGTVSVVIGGGSGHYPAFAGLVGPGLAAGAVMGNLFASPSAPQVESVAATAEAGGGVLLSYGNYAGDALNFNAAQERLRARGIECRTVVVTDDVSSAPADQKHRRRGVAGDLAVFKIAGAAADAGLSLDEVERVATRANDRTRSFGVAFAGCTLPGASEPLFTIGDGRMALGLGIHGEPGLGESEIPTADGLAMLFIDRLLAELPDDVERPEGGRAAVILNGLGAVKYEELFVVFRQVARLLEAAGVVIVDPEVGEFCTSFDMAGASLTLLWLDDELERLWCAPADSPAFRKGTGPVVARREPPVASSNPRDRAVPRASADSRQGAIIAVAALERVAATIDEHADELGRLDAVAGDGDHGIGMRRGVRAALDAARHAVSVGAGAGTALQSAGEAWSDIGGGTSGALWGLALGALGQTIGDDQKPDTARVARAVTAATAAITASGGAVIGDKTMVDALIPFRDELTARVDEPLGIAWAAAAAAATQAAASTAGLVPRRGRARPHAERSLGTPDPGARSFALVVEAVGQSLPSRDEV